MCRWSVAAHIVPPSPAVSLEQRDVRVTLCCLAGGPTPPKARTWFTVVGLYAVQVAFEVTDPSSGSIMKPDQASVIISSSSTGKDIVSLASSTQSGNHVEATFSWAQWQREHGAIEPNETFKLSIAVGNLSPHMAERYSVASLQFVKPSKEAPRAGVATQPSKVDKVEDRIAEAKSSMAVKKEIYHLHPPETTMVSPVISIVFTAIVASPLAVAVYAMVYAAGANARGFFTSRNIVLAVVFHAGIAAILAVHVAFWLKFNLMQIAPVLACVELTTLLAGIKLSAKARSDQHHAAPSASSSITETSKKMN